MNIEEPGSISGFFVFLFRHNSIFTENFTLVVCKFMFAHNGTLDTFIENPVDKEIFISGIRKICSDGKARFFVPEVNSGESDLKAVVRDVLN